MRDSPEGGISYDNIRSKADPETGKNEFAGRGAFLYYDNAVSAGQYVNAFVIMITRLALGSRRTQERKAV